ncbi:hypothetical protein HON52_00950 [Candidatus Uhrbacteria bacterium]|jgi:hypothetical protein|nr:hypothetical protein [Candidatus Uhrbacteria bacterium]
MVFGNSGAERGPAPDMAAKRARDKELIASELDDPKEDGSLIGDRVDAEGNTIVNDNKDMSPEAFEDTFKTDLEKASGTGVASIDGDRALEQRRKEDKAYLAQIHVASLEAGDRSVDAVDIAKLAAATAQEDASKYMQETLAAEDAADQAA